MVPMDSAPSSRKTRGPRNVEVRPNIYPFQHIPMQETNDKEKSEISLEYIRDQIAISEKMIRAGNETQAAINLTKLRLDIEEKMNPPREGKEKKDNRDLPLFAWENEESFHPLHRDKYRTK